MSDLKDDDIWGRVVVEAECVDKYEEEGFLKALDAELAAVREDMLELFRKKKK